MAFAVSVFVVGALGARNAPAYYAHLGWRGLASDALHLRQPLPAHLPPVFAGTPFPSVNGSMRTIEFEVRCYALVLLVALAGAQCAQ